tara:strand:- start:498 stop:629 length:132 start_codon:yes stop_codon:yes gene_type:complete
MVHGSPQLFAIGLTEGIVSGLKGTLWQLPNLINNYQQLWQLPN